MIFRRQKNKPGSLQGGPSGPEVAGFSENEPTFTPSHSMSEVALAAASREQEQVDGAAERIRQGQELLKGIRAANDAFLEDALQLGMSEDEIVEAAKAAIQAGSLPRVIEGIQYRGGAPMVMTVLHGETIPDKYLAVAVKSYPTYSGDNRMSLKVSLTRPSKEDKPPIGAENADETGFYTTRQTLYTNRERNLGELPPYAEWDAQLDEMREASGLSAE